MKQLFGSSCGAAIVFLCACATCWGQAQGPAAGVRLDSVRVGAPRHNAIAQPSVRIAPHRFNGHASSYDLYQPAIAYSVAGNQPGMPVRTGPGILLVCPVNTMIQIGVTDAPAAFGNTAGHGMQGSTPFLVVAVVPIPGAYDNAPVGPRIRSELDNEFDQARRLGPITSAPFQDISSPVKRGPRK